MKRKSLFPSAHKACDVASYKWRWRENPALNQDKTSVYSTAMSNLARQYFELNAKMP